MSGKKKNMKKTPKTKSSKGTKVSKQSNLSKIGGVAGSYFGPLGSQIGSLGGDILSKITGWGEYSVNENSIAEGNAIPSFYNDGQGMVVCHREYITDITGSVAFSLSQYAINPGLAATFPWLATVANGFEEYEMLGLVFEYRPSSGTAVSTTSAALGIVTYATNYNPFEPVFNTKQQMESYEFSTSSVPFNKMMHPVECAPRSTVFGKRFIRNSGVLSGTLDSYDLGNFQLATVGMQSAYIIGELWVSYHVRLLKPRIDLTPTGTFTHVSETAAASATAAAPFGTTGGTVRVGGNVPGIVAGSTTTINFNNPGTYFLNWRWVGTGMAGNPGFTYGANMAAATQTIFNNSTQADAVTATGSTVLNYTTVLNVHTTGTSTLNAITVVGPTSMAAGKLDLIIMPMPSVYL